LEKGVQTITEYIDNIFKEEELIAHTIACDICVIVGSSLQIYPANAIQSFISPESKLGLIDPE